MHRGSGELQLLRARLDSRVFLALTLRVVDRLLALGAALPPGALPRLPERLSCAEEEIAR